MLFEEVFQMILQLDWFATDERQNDNHKSLFTWF